MSLRDQTGRPIVCVDEDLAHTYIPMKPEPKDLSKVTVLIKRADGTPLGDNTTPWLLHYPAADYKDGRVGFRWDGGVHALAPGRYYADIQIDCRPCHRFTLFVPDCPQVGQSAVNMTVAEVTGE